MARNPLQGWPNNDDRSVVNPLSAPDPNQVTSADAWKHTINTIDGWLESEKQKAIDQGLWDPATGFPTKAGMLDAVHQYAWGMVGGTTAPGVRAMLPNLSGGIRAYHGSPHSFDKFDMSKIGTGEGAQAYGHGLYFAGNEGVARGYRDALAKDMYYAPNGQMFDPQSQLQHMNIRVAARNNGSDLDATLAHAQELLSKAPEQTAPMLQHDIGVLQSFKEAGGISKNPGHMYEVNLNVEPNRLLDWDKPLSVQPEAMSAVNAAAQKLTEQGRLYGGFRGDQTGADAYNILRKADPAVDRDRFYQNQSAGRPAATEALQQAGVPGIKYLDAGSRGAGEGTSNYVMFHPDLIQILRKYGLIGTTGGAAAATMGANTEQ